MNHTLTKVSLAAAVLLYSLSASADTFTFDGLPGANSDSFSSYSDSGFTVTAVNGDWRVGKLFGNPIPDIFCDCPTGTVSLTGDSGQTFRFTSVDLAFDGASYTIAGLLQNNPVFSQSGAIGSGTQFFTIASEHPDSVVDELRLQLSPGPSELGFNIDNIRYRTVPSPSAGVLLVVGLLGTALARDTRTRNA